MPIDASIGNTFAQCLRSILRQDPDKILVGEIRDLETAEIAVQASLTGHMVFSTLHTNDAPATVTRLRDMGLPPFLITATLEAVLAQRLVRKICKDCIDQTTPSTDTLAQLGLTPEEVLNKKFFRGRGCALCNNTGFKGRTGIVRVVAHERPTAGHDQYGARRKSSATRHCKHGMIPLRESGLEKVFGGITTIEEVIRETAAEYIKA